MVEPWLRGTLTEVDAVRRQVLHALELTSEDVERWCVGLTDDEINARPFGLPPVAFHLRHIARSLDRLLTYEAGGQLTEAQMRRLGSEMEPNALTEQVLGEVRAVLAQASERIGMIEPGEYEEVRGVGRAMLPSTVGGLMVHCAEHSQRHAGQAITTAKMVRGMRTALIT
ncbi:DinB family protein [Granulicella arctica]|uniref:DinB family protein n=1 Tax=Granulicella arctica TaxID=940613 RepID=UPI0021E08687|nr:DinB family protein [Granulicella arctica]